MLSINISELIWTIVNFILLLFLLRRFLYEPICRHMDERQARIDAPLEEERQAQAALDAADARLEEERSALREAGRAQLQQAGVRAAAESDEAIRAARREARSARDTGRERLREEESHVEARLTGAEPALAAALAGRLLHREDET